MPRITLDHIHDHLLKLNAAVDVLTALQRRALHKVGKNMATVAEVNTKLDAALAKLTANTDVLDGVATFIASVQALLADVRKQLADLIAAGNNPPELQEVSDKLDAVGAALDAQAVKEAALTNTPADPNA